MAEEYTPELPKNYVPTGFWQQHDVYKRASNAAKEKMRRHYIEMQAIGMPEKVEKNILRAAKQHPNMSPGTIAALSNTFESLEDLDDITAWSNEAIATRQQWAQAGYLDSASLAAESELGATPSNPLPQTPNPLASPLPGAAQVPNPEDDPEESHNWLVNMFGADSPMANALTNIFGSPSEEDPDPNTWDFVKALPRTIAGVQMNTLFAAREAMTAKHREGAGEEAKAYELARRYGLTTPEQFQKVFGRDDLYGKVNSTGTAEAVDTTDTGSLLTAGIAGTSRNTSSNLFAAGTKDQTIPEGAFTPTSISQAKEEWDKYQAEINGEGGFWGNTTDLGVNFTQKKTFRTPWFGGEASVRDGVLGKEEYAGTVYDIRTWDEKQRIHENIRLQADEMRKQGLQITAEDVEKAYTPMPWTHGRALAGQMGLDPESHAYSMMSGVFDFGEGWGLDPASYIPGAAFTKPVKAGARLASKPIAKIAGTNKAFEADLLMTKAKRGTVEQLRPILDRMGLSNVLRPKAHWEAGSRGLQWVDDGTGTLKPVYSKTAEDGAEVATDVRMKGATIRTVETREFTDGTFMFKRGKGWAVSNEDGTAVQFLTNSEARQYLKSIGATGRGTKGQRTALFDGAGRAKFYDNADDAKSAAYGDDYSMHSLINEDTGEPLITATKNADGTFSARGKTFQTLDDVEAATLEHIDQARDTLAVSEVVNWLWNTRHGQDVAQAMIGETSPTKIHLLSNKKIDIATAKLIAKATNMDELTRILAVKIGPEISDPRAIRNFSGINARLSTAKMKWAGGNRFQRAMYAGTQFAHNTNMIDLTDDDDIVNQISRIATEMHIAPDDMYRHLDEMTSKTSALEKRTYWEDVFLPNVFDKRLKELGVETARRAKFLRRMKAHTELVRTKGAKLFDEAIERADLSDIPATANKADASAAVGQKIASGTFLSEIGDEFSAYALLSMGQHLALPSVRELRRETNALARALRKRQPATKGGPDAADAVMKAGSAFLDGWRSLTLMNGPYILRNIGEEAFRMSMFGNQSILSHPLSYLATMMNVYHAQAGSVLFKQFDKHAKRARRMLGMGKAIRYDPEKYAGTVLVEPKALEPLITTQIDNSTPMLDAYGRKRRAASVGKDIGRRGVIEPIDVVYDTSTGRYAITGGQKRAILAVRHNMPVPVRVTPGVIDDVSASGNTITRVRPKPPEDAPHFVDRTGRAFTKADDGWRDLEGGEPLVGFVRSERDIDDLAKILDKPKYGYYPVVRDPDGTLTVGSQVKDVRGRKIAHESASDFRMLPGLLEKAETNPIDGSKSVGWADINQIDRLGFQPLRADVDIDGLAASIADEGWRDPLIVHYNPKTGKAWLGDGNHRLEAAKRLGYNRVPVKVLRSSGSGEYGEAAVKEADNFTRKPDGYVPGEFNPSMIGLDRRVADKATVKEEQISDIMDLIDGPRQPHQEGVAAPVAEPGGMPMPEGWDSGDVTAKLLFGDSVIGGTEDVLRRAKQATESYLGYLKAMRLTNPGWRHNLARVNGEQQYKQSTDVATFADERLPSQMERQATMFHGQNMLDENPLKAVEDGLEQVTYEGDPSAYVEVLADNINDLLRSKEVRDFYGGRVQSIDELVDAIFADQARLVDVYAGMDMAKIAAAKARKVEPVVGDDVSILDVQRMTDIQENVARQQVKELVEWQIETANKFLGGNTSKAVRDAFTAAIRNGEKLNKNNNDFVRLLGKELEDNEEFRASIPMMLRGVESVSRKFNLNSVATSFFEHAGNIRDILTLHPLMREEYVKEATRLMRYASEDTRNQIVKNLDLAGDDPFMRKIMQAEVAGDEGMLDVAQIERLADKHARTVAKEMFYDAAERRNWAVAMRWAAPFIQVAANSTYVWGKAFLTHTPDTYRTVRALNGFKNGDYDPVYELTGFDMEPNEEMGVDGFMYRDGYGEERFVYPGIGTLGGLLTGINAEATANSNTIDLFQDGMAGSAGPMIQFLASTVAPDIQAREDILGDLARFTQKYQLPQGDMVTRAAQSFIPTKWRPLLMTQQREVDLVQSVLAQRMQTGQYGDPAQWTEKDWQKYRADVKRDVGNLMKIEAFGKVLFPTLGSWQYEPLGHISETDIARATDMPTGDVLMSQVVKEYRKFTADYEGEDYKKAQKAFRALYGEFIDLDTLGQKETDIQEGVGASTAYAYTDREMYDSWKGMMSWMLPEGDYETQWNQKEQYLRARNMNRGLTRRRTAYEQLDFVNQYMLDAAYRAEKERAVADGLGTYELQLIRNKYLDAGLESEWGAYSEEQMAQIKKMVLSSDYERIAANAPSARYVRQYFLMRNEVQNMLGQSDDVGSMSLSSETALNTGQIQGLFMAGDMLAQQDKGFARFWSLAEREFGDNGEKIREGYR